MESHILIEIIQKEEKYKLTELFNTFFIKF